MKLNHLESLRGLAALAVAVHHFEVPSLIAGSFFQNSWVMVDFFFVLSGYVISLAYWDRLSSRKELISFQIKRFWRLYPLHLLMLLFFVGLQGIVLYLKGLPQVTGDIPSFVANNTQTFLLNAALLHNFALVPLNWNYPSWSISAEFYTYLIFGILLVGLGRDSAIRRVVMIAVMALSFMVIVQIGLEPPQIGPVRCLLAFFLGSLLFEFESRVSVETSKAWNWFGVAWLALIVGLICIFDQIPFMLQGLFPFACAVLLLALNRSTDQAPLIRLLNAKILVWLGAVSYGIYMIHFGVWWVMTLVLSLGFGVRLSGDSEFMIQLQDPLMGTAILIAGLALIIWLAGLSRRYLELPLMHRYAGQGAAKPSRQQA